jgi:hypothetical protein
MGDLSGQIVTISVPLLGYCGLFGGIICELWAVALCNVCVSFYIVHIHTEGWNSIQEYLLIHVCSWYLLIYFRDFMVSTGIFGSCSLARQQHSCYFHLARYRHVTCCYRPNITRWSPRVWGLGGKRSASRPVVFRFGERLQITHWIGCCVGPKAVLDFCTRKPVFRRLEFKPYSFTRQPSLCNDNFIDGNHNAPSYRIILSA